jgi:hypothetical protein
LMTRAGSCPPSHFCSLKGKREMTIMTKVHGPDLSAQWQDKNHELQTYTGLWGHQGIRNCENGDYVPGAPCGQAKNIPHPNNSRWHLLKEYYVPDTATNARTCYLTWSS